MATLYISEFQALGQAGLPTSGFGPNGPTQAAQQPPIAEQAVTIAAGSTASAAFNAATVLVRLSTDATCSFLFGPATGATPTALVTSGRLPAGGIEYFGVIPGTKVAVIANT